MVYPVGGWWAETFGQGGDHAAEAGIDHLSGDGRFAVCVESGLGGKRGLYAALMRLGVFLSTHPHAEQACLVLSHPRMSTTRIEEEWGRVQKTLARQVARRLAVAVVGHRGGWASSDSQLIHRILEAFHAAHREPGSSSTSIANVAPRPGQKFYEVLKVLLVRWLRHAGPISMQDLASLAGCTYPTLKQSLGRRSLNGSIRYHSNRSVELDAFPQAVWSELLALSSEMRSSFYFRDRSGGKLDIDGLMRRLAKLDNLPIAVGGVLSGRFWSPDLDLNGTPRIDLLLHAPAHKIDLLFVRKLDPALELIESMAESPSLAVHALVRAEPLFTASGRPLPWADPVETALDLYDMGLIGQVNQLLNHLRPESRPR